MINSLLKNGWKTNKGISRKEQGKRKVMKQDVIHSEVFVFFN